MTAGSRMCAWYVQATPHDRRWPGYGESLVEFIRAHDLEGNIRILGLLPRRGQIQLLRAAAALVQPSMFEGWSALVEDARLFHKHLYLSDIDVHREQNPPHAEYFRLDDPEILADMLARDWDALEPGPHPVDEAAARGHHQDFMTAYARSFLHIGFESCIMTMRRTPDGKVYLHIWRCGNVYDKVTNLSHYEEWTNLEFCLLPFPPSPHVERVDIRCPLPFPDESFDAMYFCHVYEHLTLDEAARFSAEIARVAKAGAVVRVSRARPGGHLSAISCVPGAGGGGPDKAVCSAIRMVGHGAY